MSICMHRGDVICVKGVVTFTENECSTHRLLADWKNRPVKLSSGS